VRLHRQGSLVRLELHDVEADLLTRLVTDLGELIAADDDLDPVIARLYPAGYQDDPEAAAEFAELVEAGLRADRQSRIGECLAEIPSDGGRMELNADAADRWLRVLNDLRLVIGTRIGVTEDDDLPEDDGATHVYHWLTEVQGQLIEAARYP